MQIQHKGIAAWSNLRLETEVNDIVLALLSNLDEALDRI